MDAVHIKTGVLAVLSAVGSAIANAMGGWDSALKVLVGVMAVDYITGVMLATFWQRSTKTESGALSSKAGFEGLCKKGVILLMVWVAVLLDNALGVAYIRTAIILFFVGNEGISIVENVGQMGMKCPPFLKKAFEELMEKGGNGDDDPHDAG